MGRAIEDRFKVCLNGVQRVTGKIIEALKGKLSRGQIRTETELWRPGKAAHVLCQLALYKLAIISYRL